MYLGEKFHMPKSKLTSMIICALILVSIVALLIQTTNASVMNTWTYGGVNNDYTYSIVATSDGGHLLMGSTCSYGAGNSDLWLIKVDAHGNEVWNKTFGGPYTDYGCNIIATKDGNYLLVGYKCYDNATGDNECPNGWLIKVNADGNELWNQTYGTAETADYTVVVAETADGGYALAGGSWPNVCGEEDAWLVKVDADGNEQWSRTYGDSYIDAFWSITATSDDGVVLTGSTNGETGDLWVLKLDENGNEQWSKTYGGCNSDQGWWIIATSDGGYAVSGSTYSYGAGNSDAWLLKLDSKGNLQWNQTYGGASTDATFVLTATSDGGYAMVGSTCSYGAGDSDFWLLKTDSEGVLQWNQTYGGSGYDVGQYLTVNAKGVYAVAGVTASFGAGGSDGWLIITESPQTESAAIARNGVLQAPSIPTLAVVSALLLLAVAVVVIAKRQK
jgi:hypothetical protein